MSDIKEMSTEIITANVNVKLVMTATSWIKENCTALHMFL